LGLHFVQLTLHDLQLFPKNYGRDNSNKNEPPSQKGYSPRPTHHPAFVFYVIGGGCLLVGFVAMGACFFILSFGFRRGRGHWIAGVLFVIAMAMAWVGNRDGAPRATASHRITISGFLSAPRGARLGICSMLGIKAI
jgi:hypothetical protein